MNGKLGRESLLELSDLNYREAWRDMTRGCGGTTVEEDGVLLMAGPHPHPMINNCFRTRDDVDPKDFMERALHFFGSRGHGFSLILREHAPDEDLAGQALAAGLVHVTAPPAMVIEERLSEADRADGIELRKVVDEQGVRDFADTAVRAWATYELPEDGVRCVFAKEESLLAPHIAAVVAYGDDVPLASALALVSHGVAGVYWVSTVPAARGRGLADRCTRWVGNAGFEMGARIGSLQASPMGEAIYRRMGYRAISRYPLWVKPPP